MRTGWLSGVVLVGLAIAPVAAGQGERKLELTFDKGSVTLVAQNVTLPDILAEWSRQGGSQFINLDKVPRTPLPPLQYEHQPEAVVLESLLRPFTGVIFGPRRVGTAGASQFELVHITVFSRAVAAPSSSMPVAAQLVQPMPDDEIPPVQPMPNQPGVPTTRTTTPGTGQPAPGMPGLGGRQGGPGVPVTAPGTTGRGGGGGGQ